MNSKQEQNRTRRIVLLGILTAIIIIQNFVPFLGNIPIPPLNLTIIHITVIVATLTMGTKDGMFIGAVWGLVRMFRAYTVPATPLDLLLWTNPIIALVPRVLIGTFTGWSYSLVKRVFPDKERLSIIISSVVGSLTNTILVLVFIALLFGEEYAAAIGVDYSNLGRALASIIAVNGVAEAIAAAVIVPLIVIPLRKVQR